MAGNGEYKFKCAHMKKNYLLLWSVFCFLLFSTCFNYMHLRLLLFQLATYSKQCCFYGVSELGLQLSQYLVKQSDFPIDYQIMDKAITDVAAKLQNLSTEQNMQGELHITINHLHTTRTSIQHPWSQIAPFKDMDKLEKSRGSIALQKMLTGSSLGLPTSNQKHLQQILFV